MKSDTVFANFKGGVARALASQAEKLDAEKSVTYVENLVFPMYKRKIKTIASFSTRIYGGGIERVQSQLMSLWTKMGYRIILFTVESENESDYSYPQSVTRIVIPGMDSITQHLQMLEQYIKSENIDLFINHMWEEQNVIWQCALVRMLGIPYVIYTHGNFSYDYSYMEHFLYSYRAFGQTSLVLSLAKTFAQYYQMCGCKSYLVNNPIPEYLLQVDPSYKTGTKHVLYVGRIAGEKNPIELIRAFDIIHQSCPDAILDIVGDGPAQIVKELRNHVTALGLDDVVKIHGYLETTAITNFYLNSDILLFTSETEGFPMTLLEASAHALPVVMYDLPYLTIVQQGMGIKRVNQHDYRSLAEETIRILNDEAVCYEEKHRARLGFEKLKSYNQEKHWREIIYLLEGNELSNSDSYYDPIKMDESTRCILPLLLKNIENGHSNYIKSRNKYYKVGQSILYLPRSIYRLIKRIKR